MIIDLGDVELPSGARWSPHCGTKAGYFHENEFFLRPCDVWWPFDLICVHYDMIRMARWKRGEYNRALQVAGLHKGPSIYAASQQRHPVLDA